MGGIASSVIGLIDSGRASKAVSDANIAAEHGVLNATSSGQAGIQSALDDSNAKMTAAGANATSAVNNSTAAANQTIQGTLDNQTGNLNPYLTTGTTAAQGLDAYIKSNPQFSFDPSKYVNSDGYKFQLQQGQDAINNSMAAQGLGSSGAALKQLTQFGQGLASTYYQQAFQDAQSSFQTNQNATLQNLMAGINTGQTATGQYNQAEQNAGNQQAQNTNAAGYYAGNTDMSVNQFLSQQGLQGATTSAGLGMQGAKMAGDYAVGAGQAHAGGIMAQGNNLSGLIAGVGGMVGGFL